VLQVLFNGVLDAGIRAAEQADDAPFAIGVLHAPALRAHCHRLPFRDGQIRQVVPVGMLQKELIRIQRISRKAPGKELAVHRRCRPVHQLGHPERTRIHMLGAEVMGQVVRNGIVFIRAHIARQEDQHPVTRRIGCMAVGRVDKTVIPQPFRQCGKIAGRTVVQVESDQASGLHGGGQPPRASQLTAYEAAAILDVVALPLRQSRVVRHGLGRPDGGRKPLAELICREVLRFPSLFKPGKPRRYRDFVHSLFLSVLFASQDTTSSGLVSSACVTCVSYPSDRRGRYIRLPGASAPAPTEASGP